MGFIGNSEKQEADKDDYLLLESVLQDAFEQAVYGKGKKDHGTAESFEDQISCWIQEHGFDYARGQAMKKTHQSLREPPKKAIEELRGAINFLAIAILIIELTEST